MPRALDISGQVYGRLTAIKRIGTRKNGALWLFKCSCGNELQVCVAQVRYGTTTSCGCFHKEQAAKNNKSRSTHGMTKTGTYSSWSAMKDRCLNEQSKDYANYGGRGICICSRWIAFENFLEDMGERPLNKSIDRIDVDGNYEPENCRWATSEDQARNKRNNKKRYFQGAMRCVSEISGMTGIQRKTLEYRMRAGWSLEDAVTRESNHGNGWSIKRNENGNLISIII